MPAAYEYSFIVPVYNAEKHLAECLDSLVRQGERCELVLVDDGSSDSSGKICDAYAESCERVRVFHRPNGGPAAARNFGLEHAQGAYCIFVDSDDFISADFIERLEKTCGKDKADLIFYNIEKRFADGRSEPMAEGLKREQIAGKTPEEVLAALAICAKFPASTGGKIVKTALLNENHIRFPDNLIGEDIDWTLQLLCSMKSADVFTEGTYFYRIAPDSRRAFGREKSVADQLTIIENWLKKTENDPKRPYFLSFLAYQYAVCLPFYGALPPKTKAAYTARVKNLRFLLSYGKTRKIRMIRLAVKLIGLRAASRLLYTYVVKRDGTRG